MKKIAIILTLILGTTLYASAQVIPSFQFGVKGGLNLAQISTDGSTAFSSDNRAGYNVGVYARVGALGINLQPEVYYASKSSKVTDGAGNTNTVTFNSIDVPILLGYKIGAFGLGGRLNFGPVVSFLLTKDQTFSSALGSVATGRNYRDQNYALQFGAGLDIKKLSIDLRYEKGLSTLNSNDSNYQDKLNLFNLSLGIGF